MHRLADEIQFQVNLAKAHSNELAVTMEQIESQDVVNETAALHEKLAEAKGVKIDISESQPVTFKSDATLLRRVLSNLLRNAVEASEQGDIVKLGARPEGEQVKFFVWNKASIPKEVQLQLFRRSFSTKGLGRGMGTYSVRLFTEKYLNGRVWLESDGTNGTTFFLSFPIEPPANTTPVQH